MYSSVSLFVIKSEARLCLISTHQSAPRSQELFFFSFPSVQLAFSLINMQPASPHLVSLRCHQEGASHIATPPNCPRAAGRKTVWVLLSVFSALTLGVTSYASVMKSASIFLPLHFYSSSATSFTATLHAHAHCFSPFSCLFPPFSNIQPSGVFNEFIFVYVPFYPPPFLRWEPELSLSLNIFLLRSLPSVMMESLFLWKADSADRFTKSSVIFVAIFFRFCKIQVSSVSVWINKEKKNESDKSLDEISKKKLFMHLNKDDVSINELKNLIFRKS